MQVQELMSSSTDDEWFKYFNEIIVKLSDEMKKKFMANPTNKLVAKHSKVENCVQEKINLKDFGRFLQSCLSIVFLISFEYSKKEDIPDEHKVIFNGIKQYFINRYLISSAYRPDNEDNNINNIVLRIQKITGETEARPTPEKQAVELKKFLDLTISQLTEIENKFYNTIQAVYNTINLSEILSYLRNFINSGIFVYPEIATPHNSTINLFGVQTSNTPPEKCLGLFFPVYSNSSSKVNNIQNTESQSRFILLREVAKSVDADYGIYRFVKDYLNFVGGADRSAEEQEKRISYELEFLSFFLGDLMINFVYNSVPKLELVRFLPIVFETSIIDERYNLTAEHVYVLFQNKWHKAEIIIRGDSIFLFDCIRENIKHKNRIVVESYDDRNYVCRS